MDYVVLGIVSISELISLYCIYRLWTGHDKTVTKILWSVILVIPLLGIAFYDEKYNFERPVPLSYRLLAGATVIHPTILLLIFFSKITSARIFILLGWVWFLWPIILLIHPARSLRRWFIPVGIGFLLFLPSLFGVFTMTMWKINGFAP
jgi:hypothetical protein